MGLSWESPYFTREDKPFFLPTEIKLDQLISNCRLKMLVFLETPKETGADSGKTLLIRWGDINVQDSTVAGPPTKNHNAQTRHIASHLIVRLARAKGFVSGWLG